MRNFVEKTWFCIENRVFFFWKPFPKSDTIEVGNMNFMKR